MTTNSTKYFCNRGALSARFILVDTPLRGEYYYDGEHGKYYFGARYFDPFFGMWMSPDPAAVFFREVYAPLKWRDFIEKDILQRLNGEAVLLKHSFRASAQFANPYSYGGDPINFIDPTGLWAVGLGLVVGWDKNRGWNYGFGIAASFGNENEYGINASYTWHQDGSNTFSLNASASFQYYFLNFGGNFGYSYNTYSGHSVSMSGHACLGKEGICAGIEAGGSLYWDPYGNYLGATAFAGAFAELSIGDFNAKVNAGYEIGLMGMEGRGMYVGGNVGKDGASLYASWAENGGWNYGGGYRFEVGKYIGSSNGHYLSILGGLYEDFNLTLPADGYYADDVNLINIAQKYLDENPDVFTFIAHGASDGIGLNKNVTRGVISPEEFVKRLKNHEFGYYNNEKIIQLISCNTGYGDDSFAEQVAQLMPGVTVIAPNAYVILNSRKWWHVIGDAQLLLRSNLDGNATGDEKWREFKK